MPKATSDKFSKVRSIGPAQARKEAKASSGTPSGTRNHIFNTDQLGQHVLKNPAVAQAIVDKAGVRSSDVVLEVGPGTGNLTVKILDKCKHCTAVEMDPRMAAELSKRVQGGTAQKKLDIIVGDFIKQDLPYFDVVISNTPYQISSPLVFKLLSHRPLFRVAILMFQREFAMRLVARPGDNLWNRLSANVQLYAKVDHVMKVARNNFRPPPQVESSVVRISPLDPPPAIAFEEFDGLTRIVFSRKNKTLRSNFQASGVHGMLESNYKTLCSQTGRINQDIDIKELIESVLATPVGDNETYGSLRGAKMDVNQLLALLQAFHAKDLHFS